jgi:hypothetical protein|tara:strand:+ start:38 stop:472 length:435 start_codon:yes stop_codon:yes gene_type:complete
MKSLLFLILLIFIYYQIYCRYSEYFTTKNHIYFGVFISVYLTLYYVLGYQKHFVYNMLMNIKNADEKPLYDVNSLTYQKNQMVGLKHNLAMKQGWRCIKCYNPILQKDIHNYKLHYITPLQYGGQNDISNIGILCQTCSTFSPF